MGQETVQHVSAIDNFYVKQKAIREKAKQAVGE